MINQTGIYFLLNKGKIVYIGKSEHVFSRAKVHVNYGIVYDEIRVIGCHPDKLDYYEHRWIRRFRPIENRIFYDREIKPKRPVGRPKGSNKKKKYMHFRKLTEKSFFGFGGWKESKVQVFLDQKKFGDLAKMYYCLSHITFIDSILDQIGITTEWRIEKPGIDKEKYRDFCAEKYPEFVQKRIDKNEKIIMVNSKKALRYVTAVSGNKSKLQRKNMGK